MASNRHRRLPFARKVKVMSWIQGNRALIEEKRPTYAEAAEMASEALGFPISHTTINLIVRDGIDWEWPRPLVISSPTAQGNALKYGALVAKVNRLEKQVNALLAELGMSDTTS